MEILFLAILLGLIPATIASKKGENFLAWWFYGALLFIVALPHAIIMKPNLQALEKKKISQGMKKCPYCAEMIKAEAVVCRFCGKELPK